jgi:hypothetical protein
VTSGVLGKIIQQFNGTCEQRIRPNPASIGRLTTGIQILTQTHNLGNDLLILYILVRLDGPVGCISSHILLNGVFSRPPPKRREHFKQTTADPTGLLSEAHPRRPGSCALLIIQPFHLLYRRDVGGFVGDQSVWGTV